MVAAAIDEARRAYARHAWGEARAAYASAGDDGGLTLDDMDRYAVAAHLVGEEAESRDVLALSLVLDRAQHAPR